MALPSCNNWKVFTLSDSQKIREEGIPKRQTTAEGGRASCPQDKMISFRMWEMAEISFLVNLRSCCPGRLCGSPASLHKEVSNWECDWITWQKAGSFSNNSAKEKPEIHSCVKAGCRNQPEGMVRKNGTQNGAKRIRPGPSSVFVGSLLCKEQWESHLSSDRPERWWINWVVNPFLALKQSYYI